MLALRQESKLFRIPASNIVAAVHSDLTTFGGHSFAASTLGFRIIRPSAYTTEPFSELVVLHNGNNAGITVDASGFELVFNSYGDITISSSMSIPGNTTVVLAKRA